MKATVKSDPAAHSRSSSFLVGGAVPEAGQGVGARVALELALVGEDLVELLVQRVDLRVVARGVGSKLLEAGLKFAEGLCGDGLAERVFLALLRLGEGGANEFEQLGGLVICAQGCWLHW